MEYEAIDVIFDIVILAKFSLSRFGDGLMSGWPEFDTWQGKDIFFLLATGPKLALGPTQSPVKWIPSDLSSEVKR
jgi:hypothetical protein